VRGYFSRGADFNPEFYGTTSDVVEAAGTWARPADAEAVYYVENTDGDEVICLRQWERKHHPHEPSIIRRGATYHAGENAPSGDLTFHYSRLPVDPADLDTEVDALWPPAFDEMLVLDLIIHLAGKDTARAQERETWKAEKNEWLALYDAHLKRETARHGRAAPRATS